MTLFFVQLEIILRFSFPVIGYAHCSCSVMWSIYLCFFPFYVYTMGRGILGDGYARVHNEENGHGRCKKAHSGRPKIHIHRKQNSTYFAVEILMDFSFICMKYVYVTKHVYVWYPHCLYDVTANNMYAREVDKKWTVFIFL